MPATAKPADCLQGSQLVASDRPRKRRTHAFGCSTAVAGLFTRLARDTPLLIILDDLHWADSASVQLLDFVARQCAAERVLLLGAYRTEETADALLGLGGQVLPLTRAEPR